VLGFIVALIMTDLKKYMLAPYFEVEILRFMDMARDEPIVRLCLNRNNSSFQNVNLK